MTQWWWHLFSQLSQYQDSDAMIKVNVFPNQLIMTSVKLSRDTLTEETKRLLTSEDEIDIGDKSK